MDHDRPLPDRRRAILALVMVNAMWGSSFPVMKCLNLQIDQHFGVTEFTASTWLRSGSAAWMIAIRFALALLLFAVFYRGTLRSVRPAHFWAGVAIGVLFFLGLLLQVMGLATIPASRSGFLTSLAVVFTPLIATLWQRKLPRTSSLLGAMVALVGVTILTGLVEFQAGRVTLADDALQRWTRGDSLTTLAAVFFSGQILVIDRLGKRYDSIAFTPSMFATTAVLATLVFAILQPQIPEVAAGGWTELATQPRFFVNMTLLCIFPSLLAFAWMNKYQPRVSAVQAAVIYTLEPLFASMWAMFLPALLSVFCYVAYANEQVELPLIVGGSLVLVANVLALWPQRKDRVVK
jgi:drug/metabolite transporter (DMT)-like permease